MTRVTDSILWAEVRERAARYGWDDRERILRSAHTHLCRRLKLTTDEDRDTLRGRLDRLWTQNMTDWGAF